MRGACYLGGAAVLAAICGSANAQQCTPKTTGYFTQMTAASLRSHSPVDLVGITGSLTGGIGDPARGRLVMANPDKGNCLACHNVPALSGQMAQGDLGPNLSGSGVRYTEAQLRQIVVDPSALFPDTVMPAYHKPLHYSGVPANLAGSTVLSAGEVEDIIAFLKTLR